MKMLEFHKCIITDAVSETNSLVVMAKGMGLDKVFTGLLSMYAVENSLILILNLTNLEFLVFKSFLSNLEGWAEKELLQISAENSQKERIELYKRGGVLSITRYANI